MDSYFSCCNYPVTDSALPLAYRLYRTTFGKEKISPAIDSS